MKAIVQLQYGPPERVLRMQQIEPPALSAGDALVRVRATSVNTPDWITVTGVPYILRLRTALGARARGSAEPTSPAWWRPSVGT